MSAPDSLAALAARYHAALRTPCPWCKERDGAFYGDPARYGFDLETLAAREAEVDAGHFTAAPDFFANLKGALHHG